MRALRKHIALAASLAALFAPASGLAESPVGDIPTTERNPHAMLVAAPYDRTLPWSTGASVSVDHGSAADNAGGSGLSHYEYRTMFAQDPDGSGALGWGAWSAWQTLAIGSSVPVTQEGHTEVAIRAVDVATNIGPEANTLVRIDRSAPVVGIPTGSPSAQWEQGDPGLIVSDPGYDLPVGGSGIVSYQYQVSASPVFADGLAVGNGQQVEVPPGQWFVRFRAIDAAGNIGGWGDAGVFSWSESGGGGSGELDAELRRSWGESLTDALCNLPDVNAEGPGGADEQICQSGERTWR